MPNKNKGCRHGHEPLSVVAPKAELRASEGWFLFQTCYCTNPACANHNPPGKLTIEEPNVFYSSIMCDLCGTENDCEKDGCGFMAVGTNDPDRLIKMFKK